MRVPAAMCAVVGLKVTHGLIPLDGVFPLVPSFDTVGAIAVDLDHLAMATSIMAGARWPAPPPPAPRLSLVVPRHWVDSAPLDPGVRSVFEEFLAAARSAGTEIAEDQLLELGPSPHQGPLIGREVAAIHAEWRREGRPYGADVGERIDAGLALAQDPDALVAAERWQAEITAAMERITASGRLIVTPTVAAMDKRLGEDRIGDHHYRTVVSWFSAPVNPTGLPALSMPVAGQGRTPSIQLIGPKGGEPALLAAARRLQEQGILGVPRLPSG